MKKHKNYLEEPEQMDKYTRNERLHEHLKSLGLFVRPVYVDHNPYKLDHLVVSADWPDYEATTLKWARAALRDEEAEKEEIEKDKPI